MQVTAWSLKYIIKKDYSSHNLDSQSLIQEHRRECPTPPWPSILSSPKTGTQPSGPPPPHRACRAPLPPSTGYRARGEEESKPEILENKNRAQSCPIDSPAPLPQACTPGPLCTALTPPGCSGSPGLPAGTSLSPARPCVGRTANLPEKIKIYMKSCSPLT